MTPFRSRTESRALRLALLLAGTILVLNACSGGATTASPVAPTGTAISGSLTGAINQANAAAVTINVSTGALSDSRDRISVTLDDRDPSTDPVKATANATNGAGTTAVGPINTSSLMDGPIDVFVEIINVRGASTGQLLAATLTKDTVAPMISGVLGVVVDSATVAGGATPTPNVVNRSNAASTAVQVTWDAKSESGASAVIAFSDGLTTVQSGMITTPAGPNFSVVTGMNLALLADGNLTLTLTATDAAGNETVLTGPAIIKDTFVGMSTAAGIPAGPSNPVDTINLATFMGVDVDVTLDLATVMASDELIVRLTSGGVSVDSNVVNPDPAAATPNVSFTGLDTTSLPDGPVAVNAIITDSNGNFDSFLGRAAVRDTIIGSANSVIVPASAQNPQGFVNFATQSNATVDVALGGMAMIGDTVTVNVSDGASTVTGTTTLAGAGAQTASVTGLDLSSLADGLLTLTATLNDAAQNFSLTANGNAEKGTVPPPAPTTGTVPAGAMNPAGFVNAFTVMTAQVDASFAASTEGGRSLELLVTDGAAGTLMSTITSIAAVDTAASFTGLDMSALADGPLTLNLTMVDRYGNRSPALVAAAAKDTIIVSASTASIPSGAGNTLDFIAIANAGALTFQLTLPASTDGSELVSPSVSDGATSLSATAANAAAGGGTMTFSGLDVTSLADGSVSVTGVIADPAGNQSTIGPFTFTKDTVAPSAPTTVNVEAGAANAQDIINLSNVTAVSLAVDFPASTQAGDTARYTLDDGGTSVMSALTVAPGGGGVVSAGSIDTTSLADGAINLSGVSTDAAGNTTMFNGTAAVKDTTPPDAPTMAGVIAGASNPANFFNIASQANGQIDVIFGAGSVPTDTLTVSLTDGTNTMTFGPSAAPTGAGTISFSAIDVTAFPDGFYNVIATVTDNNGNPVVFNGDQARKDTIVPEAPTTIFVMAGANNPQDFINAMSFTVASVQIQFPSSYEGTETFFIDIDDTTTTLNTVTRDAPVGGGAIDFVGIDTTTLVDGTINLTAQITDSAQNMMSYSGFTATKDIVAPTASAAMVAAVAMQNPAGFINMNSEANVSVDVTFDANVQGDETIEIVLTDATPTMLTLPVGVPPAGGGLLTYTGLDASTLIDGAVALDVNLTDPAGNTSTLNGTAATKDTVGPTSVMAVRVADTGGSLNPVGFINNASQATVRIEVDLDGTSVAGETVGVVLDDGSTTITPATMAAAGGAETVVFAGVNAAALIDGSVTLTGSSSDLAGNASTSMVTVTKDVVAPLAPTAAAVAAGASNPADFINGLTVAAVDVNVTWPVGADTTASATVTLDDGGTTAVSGAQAPVDGASQSYTPINAGPLADGAVTVSVDVTDTAGNSSNFAGTAATKDTVLPDNPTIAVVPAQGTATVNNVNAATVTSTTIDVTWGGTVDASATAIVAISDGAATVNSVGMTPVASTLVNYAGLDLSSLAEGGLSVTVQTTDPAGNVATFTGTAATLDVTAPAAPTAAQILAGAGNPADFINLATTGAVAVDLTWDATADVTATATVSLDDGVTTVMSAGMNPVVSAAQTYGGINDGALVDGAITISVDLVDPAGNSTNFVGTPAARDTVAPIAPSALSVPAQGLAPANVINLATSVNLTVNITFDGSMAGDESALLTLSDGGTTATSTITAPVGGGAATFTGVNSSALADGAVTVSVDVSDPAGNTTNFVGTAATQDATLPDAATAVAVIDSGVGVNPAGFINTASQANVSVQVDLGAGSIAGDQVQVDFNDLVNNFRTATMVAAGGVETLTFTAQDLSAFNEGNVAVTGITFDAAGNPQIMSITAIKDVTAPPAPTAASIAMTGNNPAGFVNTASQTAISVDVTWPAGADTTATAVSSVSDGVTTANSAPLNPVDNATQTYPNIDGTGIVDGAVTVSVALSDPAGNVTNFNGTAGVQDTVAPAAPASAGVTAGAMNTANVINLASVSTVEVEAVHDASLVGDETVTVTLADTGAGTVVVSGVTAPAGGGSQLYMNNDLTALAEGNISVTIDVTDPAGNTTSFPGTMALKDTTPPTAPTSSRVVVTGTNPQDFINAATVGAVQVDVVFAAPDITDTVNLTLTDGVGVVMVGPVASAATVSFAALNTAGLGDGPVSISVVITDAQGNSTNALGTTATKDTVLPDVPTMSMIASGAGNTANFISIASQGAVSVDVVIPATYDGTETVSVTLDDNATTTGASAANAPAGGGMMTLTGIDASGLVDGSVDINVAVTDTAGNPATLTGTGTQDTVAPVAPTSAGIPLSVTNPANTVNNQSEMAVEVDVAFGAGVLANETFTVSLSDGASTVTSASATAVASSTVNVSGIDVSSLGDGALTITVDGADEAGNPMTFAGTGATKDTTPPADPTADPVRANVNNTSVLVTGTATPGDTVEVDDGTTQTQGMPDANGSYQITIVVAADTTSNLTVSTLDGVLNRSNLITVDFNTNPLTVTHSTTGPDLPFSETTVAAGLGDVGSVGGASYADVDNDGDLDLFVGGTGKLWTNDGAGVFTDVTGTLGIALTSGRSATWGDYDEDGDQDLFVADAATGSFLYRNEFVPSGTLTFSDATGSSSTGVGSMLYGVGWTDYENDGDLDLVAIDADGLGNHLLRNIGGGVFNGLVGTGIETFISDPRWLSIGDLNGDGFLDIAATDASPGLLLQASGAGTYSNQAGGGMSGFVTDVTGTDGGLAFGDIDEDGDLDIVVAAGGAGGTNQLFQNDGTGTFTDVSAAAGLNTANAGRDVVFGDFNHDGRLDVYITSNGANELWLNQGDQVGADGVPEFVNAAGQAGGLVNNADDGRAACAGDVDGDGDLDVFVGNEGTANVLYRNDINDYRSLKVIVRGKGSALAGSNMDGVGAVVRITDSLTATNLMWRHIGGGRGAGNDDPEVVHFGGLTPSRAYDVQVTFLGGASVTQSMVVPVMQTNQTITLIEP